jgi:S1-C subfamily serine protease
MRFSVPLFAVFAWAALPSSVAAQQPAPGSERQTVTSSRVRPKVPYSGINISMVPQFGPGGTMRWAHHPTIATVDAGSPAARVGLRPGDILLLVNGRDAREPEAMLGEPGKVYVFRVRRGSTVREYTVTSTTLPTTRPPGRG